MAEALALATETDNDTNKHRQVLALLNACNIPCNTFQDLHGLLVMREVCIDNAKYAEIKQDVPGLKQHFSSSYLTALQASASNKQKWPLLNLIRQLLRSCNYKLTPKRIADGYTLTGEKKYKRMFRVEKMQV